MGSLIRRFMAMFGGADGTEGRPEGLALGRRFRELLAGKGIEEKEYQWIIEFLGVPDEHFESHVDLHGKRFASWSDPALLVKPRDAWMLRLHYAPQDHIGCRCGFRSKFGATA